MEHLIEAQRETRRGRSRSVIFRLVSGLSKPTGFKPFLMMTVLLILHEFSGTYILVFYTVSMFQDLGATLDPYVCTVGVGAISFVMCIVCSFLMKYFGRRTLLIFSALGMAVTMFSAGLLKMKVDNGSMEPNVSPAVCLLLYTIFNGFGVLNIPWIFPSEMFPVEMKGLGEGIVYAMSNLLMTVAVKVYPFLADELGGLHGVLWLFAGTSLVMALFTLVFIPETHNKTLAEIQDYFRHNTVYLRTKRKPSVRGIELRQL